MNDIDAARECMKYLSRTATPRRFVIGIARWERILHEWKVIQHIFSGNDPFPTTLHGLPVEVDSYRPERLSCLP